MQRLESGSQTTANQSCKSQTDFSSQINCGSGYNTWRAAHLHGAGGKCTIAGQVKKGTLKEDVRLVDVSEGDTEDRIRGR